VHRHDACRRVALAADGEDWCKQHREAGQQGVGVGLLTPFGARS
jgi:hypothetical protein